MATPVALLGDTSSHGGTIVSSGQDGMLTHNGVAVAVEGAMHSCPEDGHGTTAITPITIRTTKNGQRIITNGAVAGCGAVIIAPARGFYVE